jgi:prepilin-type N-terminal cleavage/methylation domain-containing protein
MYRKAFTLIELLVVIAIIAILAAILFPVFAQAKVAAKGTASLSNIKQHGTAWIMYANDNDDTAVPYATHTPGPLTFDGMQYSTWSQLLQAYEKSPEITQDPLVRPNASENNIPVHLLWPYRPQYGYAFTVWSPLTQITTDGRPRPVSLTAAAHPAETVLFTGRKDRTTLDWRFLGTVMWMAQAVAPPYCGGGTSATAQTNVNPQSYCAINHRWGINGHGALSPYPTDVEGGRTGSVALRKMMHALVIMSDTHAKFMRPEHLARGTNWHWNSLPTQIQLTNPQLYMWDLD